MAEVPPIPTVLAFLLCDQIVTEAGTNKKSLIGMFDRMQVSKMPAINPQAIWLYAKLADAEGDYIFRMEILKLDSGRPVLRIDTKTIQIKDRLATTDLVIMVPPMPIEEFGVYEIQLLANNIWIGRTTISVVELKDGDLTS
jgi:hypothetical protein